MVVCQHRDAEQNSESTVCWEGIRFFCRSCSEYQIKKYTVLCDELEMRTAVGWHHEKANNLYVWLLVRSSSGPFCEWMHAQYNVRCAQHNIIRIRCRIMQSDGARRRMAATLPHAQMRSWTWTWIRFQFRNLIRFDYPFMFRIRIHRPAALIMLWMIYNARFIDSTGRLRWDAQFTNEWRKKLDPKS